MQRLLAANSLRGSDFLLKEIVAVAMMSLLLPVSSAWAITVTNTTTASVLFSDNFEGVSAINVGFADDPVTTNFDPVASVGAWTITQSDFRQIQVTKFLGTATDNAVYPGAAEGQNYLWLNRTSTVFNGAVGTLSGIQSTAGEQIHIEWRSYIRTIGGATGLFNMYASATDDGAQRLITLQAQTNGTITGTNDGTGALHWAAGVWQKWKIDYTVGATQFALTLDDVSRTLNLNGTLSTGGSVGSIRFSSALNSEYFVDAAPNLIPGDFDGDGDVDGADFVAWQTHFPTASGATLEQGDADSDGDVDGADFVVWQTHFPFTPGQGVNTVPEPSSIGLTFVGLAVLANVLMRQRESVAEKSR